MPTHSASGKRIARRLAIGAAALVMLPLTVPETASARVPAPTDTTSIVTVKVGGDRVADQAVAPLAGVTLGLYTSQTGGSPLFTCVSDADGDCNFTVTDTGVGGGNRGDRFWVRQISAPAGWHLNDQFRTGTSSFASTTPYSFRTPALYSANTYSSTDSGPNGFMVNSGSSTLNASSGTWQLSRDNPDMPGGCGLDVALIMDLSGSMNGSVGDLKEAADRFVDSLQGTPSTMARFTFSSFSPAERGGTNAPALQSVSTRADGTAFKSAWADWDESTANGATNWDRATYEPTIASRHYDLAVVITDGMPTRYSTAEAPGGNGNTTRLREVENGIYSANALKAEGTRVLAVGVGSGASGTASHNLAAISGREAYDGTNIESADYVQVSDFTAVGQALHQLALEPCTPSINVVKQIRSEDGTLHNAPAGWTFDAESQDTNVTADSPQTTTDDHTGAVTFPLDYGDSGVASAPITVTERQQPGYTLEQQDGKNASCQDLLAEEPVDVTDDPGGGPGFTVDVDAGGAVSCRIINQAPPDFVPATVRVDKTWAVTSGGGTQYYDHGDQPADLASGLELTPPEAGPPATRSWYETYTGYGQGDTISIGETPRINPRLDCDLTEVDLNGEELDPAAPTTERTLDAGDNVYTMTNHVTCSTTLELNKRVEGGDADPTNWTLHGYEDDGALPGPSGISGSPEATAEVTPGARYQLAEEVNSGDPELLNYRQTDRRTDSQSNPRSTGSMNCLAYDRDGNEVLGWNDGINGGVNVSIGLHAVCSAVNEAAELRLIKSVEGGDATAGDWDFTVTPVDPDPEGIPSQTVQGAPGPEGTTVSIRPGQEYRVSESGGPSDYVLTSDDCHIETAGDTSDATITIPTGRYGTCEFVNSHAPARLTLIKDVDGGSADPKDWTLSAEGEEQTLTGRSGDAAITDAETIPGTYTLSERGPDGYRASDWKCEDANGEVPVDDGAVTLTNNSDVTCAITNSASEAPGDGSSVVPPDDGDAVALPVTGGRTGFLIALAILALANGVVLLRFGRRTRHVN